MTTQRADYLITGGLVISGTGISKQDVLVQGETILKIAPDLSDESAVRVIDATGKYVMPGIIDAHNHPYNEDRIDTFSVSAAFGGVTTVVPFIQNRRSQGIEETAVDAIEEFIEEAGRDSCLDFGVHAILVGDDDVEEQVPELLR